jgi:putative transcriptional regulator
MALSQIPDVASSEAASLLTEDSPFRGRLLVAMPSADEGIFHHSVIYLCAHGAAGAMGIVVNRRQPDVAFGELLGQLGLSPAKTSAPIVHQGGPMECGRGFVLHSGDFVRPDTVPVGHGLCITGTVDILQALADGTGPGRSLFALGYAGWGPGQLESEIRDGLWLLADADDSVIFSQDLSAKWEKALATLGASPLTLSPQTGSA